MNLRHHAGVELGGEAVLLGGGEAGVGSGGEAGDGGDEVAAGSVDGGEVERCTAGVRSALERNDVGGEVVGDFVEEEEEGVGGGFLFAVVEELEGAAGEEGDVVGIGGDVGLGLGEEEALVELLLQEGESAAERRLRGGGGYGFEDLAVGSGDGEGEGADLHDELAVAVDAEDAAFESSEGAFDDAHAVVALGVVLKGSGKETETFGGEFDDLTQGAHHAVGEDGGALGGAVADEVEGDGFFLEEVLEVAGPSLQKDNASDDELLWGTAGGGGVFGFFGVLAFGLVAWRACPHDEGAEGAVLVHVGLEGRNLAVVEVDVAPILLCISGLVVLRRGGLGQQVRCWAGVRCLLSVGVARWKAGADEGGLGALHQGCGAFGG